MELLNGVLRSCGTPFCDLRGGHLQFERRELRKGEICMELIASINSAINGFVWGVPMLVLLVKSLRRGKQKKAKLLPSRR